MLIYSFLGRRVRSTPRGCSVADSTCAPPPPEAPTGGRALRGYRPQSIDPRRLALPTDISEICVWGSPGFGFCRLTGMLGYCGRDVATILHSLLIL
jgi:hypothetical protein